MTDIDECILNIEETRHIIYNKTAYFHTYITTNLYESEYVIYDYYYKQLCSIYCSIGYFESELNMMLHKYKNNCIYFTKDKLEYLLEYVLEIKENILYLENLLINVSIPQINYYYTTERQN